MCDHHYMDLLYHSSVGVQLLGWHFGEAGGSEWQEAGRGRQEAVAGGRQSTGQAGVGRDGQGQAGVAVEVAAVLQCVHEA